MKQYKNRDKSKKKATLLSKFTTVANINSIPTTIAVFLFEFISFLLFLFIAFSIIINYTIQYN